MNEKNQELNTEQQPENLSAQEVAAEAQTEDLSLEMSKESDPEENGATTGDAVEGPLQDNATEPVAEPLPKVVYRWDYDSQRRFGEAQKKKARKGAVAFAAIIIACFLLVIGLLIGTLVFRDAISPKYQTLTTVEIAEKLLPSTVLLTCTNASEGTYGSGFFVRQDGMIVTNYHVVAEMDKISVKLYKSNQKLDATLIGYNVECDIAVIKVPGSGYPAVTFGDSDALRAGETAIAIGNPEGVDAEWSVTQGIISSVDRKVLAQSADEFFEQKMIQTDAAVNPGNSGCLLCNDRGEVIGIIARKRIYQALVSVTIFDEGIGFAIPGNGAKAIIEDIINTKNADPVAIGLMRVRPKIGITVKPIKKGEWISQEESILAPADGIMVASSSNSLLQPGDIIFSFDGRRITESEDLIEMLYSYKRGDKVTLKIYKKGEFYLSEIQLELGVFDN